MNKTSGIVRSFRIYTPPQAEQMKKDLGIQMPLSMLAYCANYYRRENRDPYIEELKMLDALSRAACQDASSVALKELLTNDSFVADTYADLVQKRKELSCGIHRPCTLADAATTANDYIARAGKRVSVGIRVLPEERNAHAQSGLGKDCISCDGSAYQFRLLPRLEDGGAPDDDYWMLLLPSAKMLPSAFERKLGAWMTESATLSQIKGIYTVGSKGLLHELLKRTVGVWVDLARFVPLGKSANLSVLTTDMSVCRLLRVSKQTAEQLQSEWKALGLLGGIFARSIRRPQLKISMQEEPLFSLSTEFLRTLFVLRPGTAKMHKESGTASLCIRREPISTANCRYFATSNPFAATEQGQKNGCTTSIAATEPEQAPFFNALYTALAPVVALCVAGHPYTRQLLTAALRFPAVCEWDEAVCGDCMATILGLYRVQSELGIPAEELSVDTEEGRNLPNLTVLSAAEGAPAKTQWQREGSGVYCIQLPSFESGMPDFAALRSCLNNLSRMAEEHNILSAAVLLNESITDGIRRMNTDGIVCRLEQNTMASDGKLPLAVLLECEREIPATRIGKTVKKKACAPTAELPLPTPLSSLIFATEPPVVILSKKGDRNAESLCAILNERQCKAQLFDDTTDSAPALSGALLNAWVLIFCPEAALSKTEQVSFALDTMKRAGGLLLSLGNRQEAQQQGAFHCANGITEQIVASFFQKTQKI